MLGDMVTITRYVRGCCGVDVDVAVVLCWCGCIWCGCCDCCVVLMLMWLWPLYWVDVAMAVDVAVVLC